MQDADQAAVAAIDLQSKRLCAKDGSGAERCAFASLDEEHFRSRPGLRVLQMAWHPGDCIMSMDKDRNMSNNS
jgi:hypothetical protein